MGSPEFHRLLDECRTIHDKKSHDYATKQNPFSNFERAAEIVSYFKNPIDQVFACMIAIKLTRLAELRNGKEPNNESARDSHIDLVNYSALWGSYYDSKESLYNKDELDLLTATLKVQL